MYIFISMLVLAIVTYLPRVIPLVLNREIKSNYIKSMLYYMPYCVLGAMTFPAIFYSTSSVIASTIGAIGGIILAYKEQSLIKVACGSVVGVYIINMFI